MKNNNYFGTQIQKPAAAPAPIATAAPIPGKTAFVPSPDEVSRRAYFAYVNEGEPQGRHVQHWLQAEAELITERNRTRQHEYRN
jgi:hypothetical protein